MRAKVYYYQENNDEIIDSQIEKIKDQIFPDQRIVFVKNLTNYVHFIICFDPVDLLNKYFSFSDTRPILIKSFDTDINIEKLPIGDPVAYLVHYADDKSYELFLKAYKDKVEKGLKRLARFVCIKLAEIEGWNI